VNKSELRRLIKIERRINEIVKDDLGLKCYPIEFDIVPPQKMLEIMAYNIPTNISNWKKGRDYERERTIYEHSGRGMPYEVVVNSDPAKAYLMNNNRFAVQCLVMSHVYGHCAFFATNKYFRNSRQDIVGIMYEASRRFLKYEHRFGIDEVEKTVDAGHALQWHSSPFESNETQNEKRRRIFEQEKQKMHASGGSFGDITGLTKKEINEDLELFNQKLWRSLKLKTPVEPTEDLLGYITDNSRVLEDWQKDILEVLRMEGQYYWPMTKTQYMNEGFATVIHEKVMNKLFEEGLLKTQEHADYNYSNSLVKQEIYFKLNPYLIGSEIWRDIEDRWNKGRQGDDWENCQNAKEKENWDTGAMEGWQKCLDIMETYVDWFFLQDFLTTELVRDLKLYIFKEEEKPQSIDYVITKDDAKEIKRKLVHAFSQSSIPKIEIVDGDYNDRGWLNMVHKYDGIPLEETYTKRTMKHIAYLWGKPVCMDSRVDEDTSVSWRVSPEGWEAGDDAEDKSEEEEKKDSNWRSLQFHVPDPLMQSYLFPW